MSVELSPRARRLRAARAAVLLVALSAYPGNAVAREARWQERAAMPTPRHEQAYAKSGGRIYSLGGLVAGVNAVPFVDVYDPRRDEWSAGPPLPYAPNHAMAAAHRGVVYHLGGYVAGLSMPTDRALALRDGAWEELPPMPEPRAAAAAAFLGGKLYVIGGATTGGMADESFVFDPSTEEWSSIPGPATPREHHTLVRYDGALYALGGRVLTFETTMSSVERFDPATKTWSPEPPLPYAAAGHVSAVTRNGMLVVLGGETAAGPLADAYALDLRSGRWLRLEPLDPARTGFGTAAIGSVVYSFGGAGTETAYYDVTEAIDLRSVGRR